MKTTSTLRSDTADLPLVLSEAQLRSLGSPARHEVFATLLRIGPASVAELAEALGQPADGLYYHVRQMMGAGLVQDLGKRPAATRHEAVYAVTARLIRTHPTTRASGYLEALQQLFASTFRLLARRIGTALHDPALTRTGPSRQLTVRTQLVRLDDLALVELNRKLDAINRFLGSRSGAGGGTLYQVVLVATKVVRDTRSGR